MPRLSSLWLEVSVQEAFGLVALSRRAGWNSLGSSGMVRL